MPKTDTIILLGKAVKYARSELGLTQKEVAKKADINERTILNIENYRGNPTLQVISPIFRVLNIDSREIFNPENEEKGTSFHKLTSLLSDCTEKEADILFSVCNTLIISLRKNDCSTSE
ncbi:MAG: helix-turn-helix transcriptional regulator [Clostridiales bacterium]|nr:helix-turn-helix transcriptional regulator [Clostridiales bacterium]